MKRQGYFINDETGDAYWISAPATDIVLNEHPGYRFVESDIPPLVAKITQRGIETLSLSELSAREQSNRTMLDQHRQLKRARVDQIIADAEKGDWSSLRTALNELFGAN